MVKQLLFRFTVTIKMGRYYQNPGAGSLYQHCALCRRPFHIYRCRLLKNNGKFCSMKCYHAALRAFSEALASDRLELILGRASQNAKGALAEPGEVWNGGYGG
jgi:hypothetical protein